jgi:NLI interacting factor-like phosphatase
MEKFVVLDIDSTLVYARPADMTEKLVPDERNFYVRPVSMETVLKVTKRKNLDKFLDDLYKEGYKIVIWSAGVPSYVKSIVSVLFLGRSFEYVLTSDHIVDGVKKLEYVRNYVKGFRPENARLVDDNSNHGKNQEKLLILIKSFEIMGRHPTDEEDDDVLGDLVVRINKSFK